MTVRFVGGQVNLGGLSVGVGIAVDHLGRLAITSSFGGSTIYVDSDFSSASKATMISAGLTYLFSAKANIILGQSNETLENYININKPSINFEAHYALFGGSISPDGQTYSVSIGPGYSAGANVSVTAGAIVKQTIPAGQFLAYLYATLRVTADIASGVILSNIRCFPGHTLISLPDGTSKPIREVVLGESVLSFDPHANGGRGKMVSGVVTKIFSNVTTEWLQLDFAPNADGSPRRPLIATPGHETLRPEGGFIRLDQMVVWTSKNSGTITLVNQDATTSTAVVARITYSAATAEQFEQAVVMTGDRHTSLVRIAELEPIMVIGVPDPRLGAIRFDHPINDNREAALHAG